MHISTTKTHFFDKEHTLISQRYQLHPAPATTTALEALRMHTTKKERRIKKRKIPLQ
jgi:hypothetical protein